MSLIEIILYLCHKDIFDVDMEQWNKYHVYKKEGILSLNYLLWFYKSFGSSFIFRIIDSRRFYIY